MGFYQQAEEKLRMDFSRITGQKEAAMKTPVRDEAVRAKLSTAAKTMLGNFLEKAGD